MKTILIAAVCVGVASLSAIAGTCPGGGCGDKGKGDKGKGDKGKEAPKESALVTVVAE
ncbi:MAG: hypothetical protein WEB60_06030 [Terrimicrobiaceae bacterium]